MEDYKMIGHTVIELTEEGLDRVLGGQIGMTFIVDSMSGTAGNAVVHVRDYRYPTENKPYQIWSISPDGYNFINKG